MKPTERIFGQGAGMTISTSTQQAFFQKGSAPAGHEFTAKYKLKSALFSAFPLKFCEPLLNSNPNGIPTFFRW